MNALLREARVEFSKQRIIDGTLIVCGLLCLLAFIYFSATVFKLIFGSDSAEIFGGILLVPFGLVFTIFLLRK